MMTRRGFTLIEVVISASLMALIMVSAYLCLNAAFSGRKEIEPRLEIIQNARVAMAIMTADLRAACPLSKDYDLIGMPRTLGDVQADNLDFATHNYTPKHPGEGDFCQESFFVQRNRQTGLYSLWRRRNPRIALDPLSGGSIEEIATGLAGLKLEYFDGFDWSDSWGDTSSDDKAQTSLRQKSNLQGMPQAIRITLMLDSNPQVKPLDTTESAPTESTPTESASIEPSVRQPPLIFQSVARLNLAAPSSQANSTDTSAQSGSGRGGGNQ
jgi:prepilin-type N-terminal cleavage/methylation domain-containing protein